MGKKNRKVNDLDHVLSVLQSVVVRLRELRSKYMMEAWAYRHRAHTHGMSERQSSGYMQRMMYAILSAKAVNRTLVNFLLLRTRILERAFEVSEL